MICIFILKYLTLIMDYINAFLNKHANTISEQIDKLDITIDAMSVYKSTIDCQLSLLGMYTIYTSNIEAYIVSKIKKVTNYIISLHSHVLETISLDMIKQDPEEYVAILLFVTNHTNDGVNYLIKWIEYGLLQQKED